MVPHYMRLIQFNGMDTVGVNVGEPKGLAGAVLLENLN